MKIISFKAFRMIIIAFLITACIVLTGCTEMEIKPSLVAGGDYNYQIAIDEDGKSASLW